MRTQWFAGEHLEPADAKPSIGVEMRDTPLRLVVAALLVFCFAADSPRAADLIELYGRASEYDPTFQGARYAREIAQQGLKEAKAGVLPTISGTADASKVYQNIKESDSLLFTVGRTDFFNYAYSISLTQPVYAHDAFTRLPQARAEVHQAAYQYADAEQDLFVRLAEALFTCLAGRDNLDFATAEQRSIQQQLQESEERLTAGLGRVTDVHEARARFALAQASSIDASNQLQDSLQALAEITGEAPTELPVLSETFPLVQPDRPEVETWVEAALFQNPRIKALEVAAEIAQQEIRRQRSGRMPQVDLVTSFANQNNGGTEFGGGNLIARTNLALQARIPIFDSGRTSALTRSASLQYKLSLERVELERRQVQREARAAFQGVMTGITRVEAFRQSVFSNEAALAAKTEGLRAGLATGKDVLDARQELFEARRDLAAARYIYILDSLRLKQAAGIVGVQDLRGINAYFQ
jgi:outer membrane protein